MAGAFLTQLHRLSGRARHRARFSRAVVISLIGLSAAAQAATPADWAAAKEAIATLDWPAAQTRYAALAAGARRGSADWSAATFCHAVACQHVTPASAASIGEASRLYHDVIAASSNEDYVARAMMNLGRIAELPDYVGDTADPDAARLQYENVMRRWPDRPIGSEAALRAAATLIMAYDAPAFAKVHAGIDRLKQWATDHPNNPYAGVMWQYAGDTYFDPLIDYKSAMACYDNVDRIGWPDDGNQGSWLWRCAKLAEDDLHDRDKAVHYYTEMVIKTPMRAKAYQAIQALQRYGAPVPFSRFLPTTQPTDGGRP